MPRRIFTWTTLWKRNICNKFINTQTIAPVGRVRKKEREIHSANASKRERGRRFFDSCRVARPCAGNIRPIQSDVKCIHYEIMLNLSHELASHLHDDLMSPLLFRRGRRRSILHAWPRSKPINSLTCLACNFTCPTSRNNRPSSRAAVQSIN